MFSQIKQIKPASWAIMALIVALLASFNQITGQQKTILKLEVERDTNIALSGYHIWREFGTFNRYLASAWHDFEANEIEQSIANLNQAIPRLRMLNSVVELYNQSISHQWLETQNGVFYRPRLLSEHITASWANDLSTINLVLSEQGHLDAEQTKQFKAIQIDVDRFAYHFTYDILIIGDPQQLEFALTHWCGTLQTEDAKFNADGFGDSSFVACDYFDELMQKQSQR